MEYTKKFWNDSTFSSISKGYIGISEGVAYDYYNGKKIESINKNYYTNLLLSNKNFYRDFNTKLELPYKKSDIQLAANDFLYSSIINDIVNKLQLNNQYIYQNSIIADGKLSVPENKVSASTVSKAGYDISALDNKVKTHYIKNNNGVWADKASLNVSLIKNNGGYKDSTFGPITKEEIITKNWLYDAAENANTYNIYHSGSTIQKDIIIDNLTNVERNNIDTDLGLVTTEEKTNLNSDKKLKTHPIEFICIDENHKDKVTKAVKSLFEINSTTTPFSNIKTIYLRFNSITFLSKGDKPTIIYAHRSF